MRKRGDIICGWPEPTDDQIKQFQDNHHIDVDGIIGRQTRKRIWRERGESGYTHLIDTPLEYLGDMYTAKWIRWHLVHSPSLVRQIGLEREGIITIWRFLTSQYKTGLAYLSTQDGITLGPRRLASSSLQRVIRDNEKAFRKHLSESQYQSCITERPDDHEGLTPGFIPDLNNGFPLNDEDMRIAFLNAAKDKEIWKIFLNEGCEMIQELMEQYPYWTDARLIALACRAANSARYQFTQGLPQTNEKRAYRRLRREYGKSSGTRKRRIERIENFIPKGLKWRRL